MPVPPRLDLFSGNRDLIETLEEALALARSGELLGVMVCGVAATADGLGYGWNYAWNDDLPQPWANMLAASISASDDLRFKGLREG